MFFIPVFRVRTVRLREVKERVLSLPEHVRAGRQAPELTPVITPPEY